MKLSAIFEKAPEIEIEGICDDSRLVKKNDMYFCIEGLVNDGHKYIEQAISLGAVCIVHQKELDTYKDGIIYIKVQDVNETLNVIASKFYDYPSKQLMMFAVTGTNGKTTVANIIQDLFSQHSACGYIGTIGIRYGDISLPPTLTTPDPISLHKTMRDMLNHNMKACAMEVSSHGLELGRVKSIDFDVAIYTNLSYDHLDFHGTFEKYCNAKKRLFTQLKEDAIAIINVDDAYADKMQEDCKATIVSYGIVNDAMYKADNITIGIHGSSFELHYEEQSFLIETNLVAMYNIYNLLAAIAAIHASGVGFDQILPYISKVKPIEGRMERIEEGQPFTVIVDFAHTPDGLEKVFEYAKSITKAENRIITVFGSAGKRDSKKRKVFGEIADKYCDLIILTEDDPRDEDPKDIAMAIRSGIKNTNNIYIENRYDAIRQAIESANVEDCILILGKGDEEFMHRFDGKKPWIGDHIAASRCIRKYYLGLDES